MKLDGRSVAAWSNWTAAFVFVLFVTVFKGSLTGKGLLAEAVLVVLGTATLEGLRAGVSHLLVTRVWARQILGEWFYVSYPGGNESLDDAGFAQVKVFQKGGNLHYKADLYDRRNITGLLQGADSFSHGTAWDKAFMFEGGNVEILYEVKRNDDPGRLRRGLLEITLLDSGNQMTGAWVTARAGDETRTGTMNWKRRADFEKWILGR